MKKIVWIIIASIFISIFFIGCKEKDNEIVDENKIHDNREEREESKSENREEKEIENIINNMTIDEKIGQLLIVGLDGTNVDENITRLIQNNYVGGVIFFSNNVESTIGVVNLINELKLLNKENKIPLFISVDEEGGSVSRTPDDFYSIPSSSYIGSFNDENLAYNVGNILGEEVKALGYNMDFAPVLDILSNPNNTVIGNRALGTNADIVSRLGVKEMEGIRDKGVIPVVKHFPGHGDTAVDSHYGLPLVEKSLDELNSLEFIPFKEAIKSGADSIMVSHILLSQIDNENPATMSKIVITDILRDNLKFEGVVFSDDMTMGAIIENYNIGDASVKAINAGIDILLICHGYDNELEVINSIKNAVDNNLITEERINESLYRILKLKKKYNINDEEIESNINIEEINNSIKALYD